jgi:hypothetical protein
MTTKYDPRKPVILSLALAIAVGGALWQRTKTAAVRKEAAWPSETIQRLAGVDFDGADEGDAG